MSVALLDAPHIAHIEAKLPYIVSPDIVYADDPTIVSSTAENAQAYLDAITAVGKSYGLGLNLAKTVLLRLRGSQDITGFDGKPLRVKTGAGYLGGLISIYGLGAPELGRRLGEGAHVFSQLAAVWKHANIPLMRKYRSFESCVLSNLLYCLDSLWILTAGLRKLDVFFAARLRKNRWRATFLHFPR